ncbi:DUF2877 domain-containing protein [Pseudonocardia acaciae]|uniref:DUF2877 domain-containing protein n=1 Tax=Pseudonocardia acaciae TaxID=551276 RepID=UPI0006879722|nr:DUF2877 domain-containing protein [Pseudonocardia acaciae]
MKFSAAASTTVGAAVSGEVRPARWLGVGERALYLMVGDSTVVAVVTHDAVRLPCAVVLPSRHDELSLHTLAGTRPAARVGAGRIEWLGPAGTVVVEVARWWRPPRVRPGRLPHPTLGRLRHGVAGRDIGVEARRVAALAAATDEAGQAEAAVGLLGRGPGLTPSGDDVLAGFLVAARAFGRPSRGVERAVALHAGRATSALSAQLLRHAARGECAEQLATVLTSPRRGDTASTARPVARLLAVGHTSGAALAHGVLAAATTNRIRAATGVAGQEV